MDFDVYNPDTWYLVNNDDVFQIKGCYVYNADFKTKVFLKDFIRFLQHNIDLQKQYDCNFNQQKQRQLIAKLISDSYTTNTKEGVMEFYQTHEIANIAEWDSFPDIPLVFKGEIIINTDTGLPVRARDFIKLAQVLRSVVVKRNVVTQLTSEHIENILQRMLNGQRNPQKPFILTPETEDKKKPGFKPIDESTWNLASERRIMRVKGVLVYSTKKDNRIVYTSESQWCGMMKYKFALGEKQGQSRETIIKKDLDFNYMFCNPKDLDPVFVVNGFSFSKALCDTAMTGKEELEKIANAMNYCKEQGFKKYQYKQYFWDNMIPAHKEYFLDIYFAEQYKLRKDIDDLIVDFYSSFEPESESEIQEIISESYYLNAHKSLIKKVEKNLKRFIKEIVEYNDDE